MTEWTIIIMPPSITMEIEDAKGLNRMMPPQIRSIAPSRSHSSFIHSTPFFIVTITIIA